MQALLKSRSKTEMPSSYTSLYNTSSYKDTYFPAPNAINRACFLNDNDKIMDIQWSYLRAPKVAELCTPWICMLHLFPPQFFAFPNNKNKVCDSNHFVAVVWPQSRSWVRCCAHAWKIVRKKLRLYTPQCGRVHESFSEPVADLSKGIKRYNRRWQWPRFDLGQTFVVVREWKKMVFSLCYLLFLNHSFCATARRS